MGNFLPQVADIGCQFRIVIDADSRDDLLVVLFADLYLQLLADKG
jgi:hypothetical protein